MLAGVRRRDSGTRGRRRNILLVRAHTELGGSSSGSPVIASWGRAGQGGAGRDGAVPWVWCGMMVGFTLEGMWHLWKRQGRRDVPPSRHPPSRRGARHLGRRRKPSEAPASLAGSLSAPRRRASPARKKTGSGSAFENSSCKGKVCWWVNEGLGLRALDAAMPLSLPAHPLNFLPISPLSTRDHSSPDPLPPVRHKVPCPGVLAVRPGLGVHHQAIGQPVVVAAAAATGARARAHRK